MRIVTTLGQWLFIFFVLFSVPIAFAADDVIEIRTIVAGDAHFDASVSPQNLIRMEVSIPIHPQIYPNASLQIYTNETYKAGTGSAANCRYQHSTSGRVCWSLQPISVYTTIHQNSSLQPEGIQNSTTENE